MLHNTMSRSGVSQDVFPKKFNWSSLDADKSGTVEKEELLDWVMKGLRRSREERERTRLRGPFEKRLDDFLSACRVFASKLKNLEDVDNGKTLFLEKESKK